MCVGYNTKSGVLALVDSLTAQNDRKQEGSSSNIETRDVLVMCLKQPRVMLFIVNGWPLSHGFKGWIREARPETRIMLSTEFAAIFPLLSKSSLLYTIFGNGG